MYLTLYNDVDRYARLTRKVGQGAAGDVTPSPDIPQISVARSRSVLSEKGFATDEDRNLAALSEDPKRERSAFLTVQSPSGRSYGPQ